MFAFADFRTCLSSLTYWEKVVIPSIIFIYDADVTVSDHINVNFFKAIKGVW